MTCNDFQRELPEFLEQSGRESQAHLEQCESCSAVVSDLRMISQQARTLQASDEPSPRVWNSIEIALRQEGLIRPQPTSDSSRVSLHSLIGRWGRAAWLVPAAAVVLVGAFILGNPRHSGDTTATRSAPTPRVLQVSNPTAPMSDEDQQVLSAVNQRNPMMTAAYETNLHNVNEYIRDAQEAVDQNPNDEEARHSLMDAYEQKTVLYNLALDHSLQ
jgi:hypothetical protein